LEDKEKRIDKDIEERRGEQSWPIASIAPIFYRRTEEKP
jgi:hypothetical protein